MHWGIRSGQTAPEIRSLLLYALKQRGFAKRYRYFVPESAEAVAPATIEMVEQC